MNVRNYWTLAEVLELFALPFMDLMFKAQQVHRHFQVPNTVQISTRTHVRLSAGRSEMSDALQALCFLAGANSIFYGEKLLTTGNPDTAHDRRLFLRLKITAEGDLGAPQPARAPESAAAPQPPAMLSAAGA